MLISESIATILLLAAEGLELLLGKASISIKGDRESFESSVASPLDIESYVDIFVSEDEKTEYLVPRVNMAPLQQEVILLTSKPLLVPLFRTKNLKVVNGSDQQSWTSNFCSRSDSSFGKENWFVNAPATRLERKMHFHVSGSIIELGFNDKIQQ